MVEWRVGRSAATASNGARRRCGLGSGHELWTPLYARRVSTSWPRPRGRAPGSRTSHLRPWQWGPATPRLAPVCVPASRARGGGCLAAAFCLEPQYSGARMLGQARTPRHMHAAARASACAGRRAGCRHVGSAPERGQAKFEPVNAALTKANSRFLNCAAKMLDTKVVDETSFYNICKG
jgi:hypothetical protein